MSNWNTKFLPVNNGHINGNNGNGNKARVKIILAGDATPGSHLDLLSNYFMQDSRFIVFNRASDAGQLERFIQQGVDAAILDAAGINGFPNAGELLNFITKNKTANYYLILPSDTSQAAVDQIKTMPGVKDIYPRTEYDPMSIANSILRDVEALKSVPGMKQASMTAKRGTTIMVAGGLTIAAVWNMSGGTGKSTIACGIAQAAALRGVKTLLVGLGNPDSLPVKLHLGKEPSINDWLARPTASQGLVPALQKVDKNPWDILVGLQDPTREEEFYQTPQASISNLTVAAGKELRYGCIVLDAQHNSLASNVISAANFLILVAKPTVEDAINTGIAYRTVMEKMAGQHSIGETNVCIVLNGVRERLLPPKEFHECLAEYLDNVSPGSSLSVPSIISMIPDLPELSMASNNGRPPLMVSDVFARCIYEIVDQMLGTAVIANNASAAGGKVVKLGPITFRSRG